ncbi:MAG: hypothetical protein GTN38_03405 [Candidatus Aenigmarchaeota archaeon]|nr:hypothetical protein [Candidatus Aenigmarchaeota archaeon]NIP40709.1 hypothetical protein [Candidatus Aenigmarchaeota archaeon]NIQ18515.1 hypothetical protein [Candidatus Aenigmarchaeota archaeon]NIS73414.1 hypothetical protein [Candidatus Aenigmarchaeota archaeon]
MRLPNKRKVFIVILIFLVGNLSGIFINAITGDTITDFVNIYLFGKYSDVTVTLNHIFRMPGEEELVNISKLPSGLYGFHYNFHSGDEMIIVLNKDIGREPDISLEIDGSTIADVGLVDEWNFVYRNGSIEQYNCFFLFFYKLYTTGGRTYQFCSGIDKTAKGCPECYEKTIEAINSGNNKLENFKLTVCFDGFVNSISGDIKKKGDKCIEIRTEHFLPDDKLSGTVFVDNGWDVESFSAWDEYHGKFPNDRLLQNLIFIVPNCNLD